MNRLYGIFSQLEVIVLASTGNETSVWIIEQWAQESLMLLEANMIAANMVYRDYEDKIATEGETVNARIPGTFLMKRTTDTTDVTVQAAKTTSIAVVLDQHLHVSFTIRDGEESKSLILCVMNTSSPPYMQLLKVRMRSSCLRSISLWPTESVS